MFSENFTKSYPAVGSSGLVVPGPILTAASAHVVAAVLGAGPVSAPVEFVGYFSYQIPGLPAFSGDEKKLGGGGWLIVPTLNYPAQLLLVFPPGDSITPLTITTYGEKSMGVFYGPGSSTQAVSGPISSYEPTALPDQIAFAAQPNRLGGTLYNDGSAGVYIAFALSADSANARLVPPGGGIELPAGFAGDVHASWSATSSTANIGKQKLDLMANSTV